MSRKKPSSKPSKRKSPAPGRGRAGKSGSKNRPGGIALPIPGPRTKSPTPGAADTVAHSGASWSRAYMEKSILKLLQNHGDRAFRAKEIATRLDIKERADYILCRDTLDELVASGKAALIKGNRFGFRPPANIVRGTVRVHADGFGFVAGEDGEEYFVKGRRMGVALDGDTVEIALDAPPRDDRRREGEVLRVVERGRKTAVGTFKRHGHFGVVSPDDRRFNRDIYVAMEDAGGAKDGDKVMVSIDRYDDPRSSPEGRVLNVIGDSQDPRVRVLAIAMSVGVDADFPPEALAEAEAARDRITAADLKGREDFRKEGVFTIDPVDARDFDDALHLKRLDNGLFEVGVHIADVSHFVTPGSALDKAAYERGTSTYLVDRVIPMLPERLSGNLCSLRPNEDRLSYSCVFQMDENARVANYRITPSAIHSKMRLTYEQAQEIIQDKVGDAAAAPPAPADKPKGRGKRGGAENLGATTAAPKWLVDDLQTIASLARKLTEERFERGAIDFDLPEVRVVLDEQGVAVDIIRKDRMEANRLIEEFMLLANRTVAEHFAKARPKGAFMNRVHEHPNKEKIKSLVEYVRAFGYDVVSKDGTIEPTELNRLIMQAKGKPEEPVIQDAALRAMAKAHYSPDDVGHFGLGVKYYAHFTSPIRRYPDLIVHRILRLLAEGKPGPEFGEMKHQGDHLSERERVSDEAQRESIKLKKVEYMQQHVGDEFTGVISGVTRFGLFIELDAILVEGLIHVRELSDDYYEYDEPAFMLVGRSSGRRYRLGDPVKVVVAAANTETREIDFVFA